MVDDARAANTAIEDLGGVESQIFYQQHLPGELLGYGAVFRDDEPVQELTATERKSLSDPLGPTAQAEATTEIALRTSGRRARDALRVRGFFSAEFLRTPDGQVACIDVCTHVWGNFLCWTGVGLDLSEGYLYALGCISTPPTVTTPRTEEPLGVFPVALLDVFQHGTWPAALRAAWRDGCRYAPITGVRYCVLAVVPLLVKRARARHQHPPVEPSRNSARSRSSIGSSSRRMCAWVRRNPAATQVGESSEDGSSSG